MCYLYKYVDDKTELNENNFVWETIIISIN